jgi:hypothetical protein
MCADIGHVHPYPASFSGVRTVDQRAVRVVVKNPNLRKKSRIYFLEFFGGEPHKFFL